MDQTWMFVGEQRVMAFSSSSWKCAISSLEVALGSGRRRPAENAAFAMATLCEAIADRRMGGELECRSASTSPKSEE